MKFLNVAAICLSVCIAGSAAIGYFIWDSRIEKIAAEASDRTKLAIAEATRENLSKVAELMSQSVDYEKRLRDIENTRLPQVSSQSADHERRLRDIENVRLPKASSQSADHEGRLRDIENVRLPKASSQSADLEGRLRNIENVRLPKTSSQSADLEGRLRDIENVRLPKTSSQSADQEQRLRDIENVRLPQMSSQSTNHEARLRDIENVQLPKTSSVSTDHEERLRDIENVRLPQASSQSADHEERLRDIEITRLPNASSLSTDHEERLREIENVRLPKVSSFSTDHEERLRGMENARLREVPALSVEPVVRASSLADGQILIVGVKAHAPVPYYPVRVLANFSSARQMRFGNTLREMELSEWKDYAAESLWNIRTGPGVKELFAEFKLSDGHIVRTGTIAPPHERALGDAYSFPPRSTQLFPPGYPNHKIKQNFETGPDGWSSYDYDGGYFAQNVFYPLSWSPLGYVWTDDSRWRRDTPEHPETTGVLVTTPRWLGLFSNDLSGTKIILTLRGAKLNLRGGKAYFFILDRTAHWVKAEPLRISNDQWTTNVVELDTGSWFKSWESTPSIAPHPCYVTQLGVAFVGYDQEPTGSIQMNRFEIEITNQSAPEGFGSCGDEMYRILEKEAPGLSQRPMPLAVGASEQ